MCFYPVCIILRPAAALSAAARAHLGPGSTSSCSSRSLGLADPTAAFVAEPGQKRSLLITRGRHSRAAELFSLKTPPHPPFTQRPACPLRGPLKGGRARGEGGALGSRAALLDLTFARSESPGARSVSKPVGLGLRASVHSRPQQGRGRWGWGPCLHIAPGVLPILIVGTFIRFHNFFFKSLRPNIEYSKVVSWNVL